MRRKIRKECFCCCLLLQLLPQLLSAQTPSLLLLGIVRRGSSSRVSQSISARLEKQVRETNKKKLWLLL